LVAPLVATEAAGQPSGDELEAATGGDRLPRLVDALRASDSFKVRATAAVALGRIGDGRAAPALSAALRDDAHYAVRLAAASALGRLARGEGVPALLAALRDGDPFVRDEASAALQRFYTPERVFAFRDALESDDALTRLVAVRAYGEVLRTQPNVAPLVIGALGDEHDDVRRAAEQAVSGLAHDKAVPLLVGALSGSRSAVKANAARLLAARADPSAVESLMRLVASAEEAEDVRAPARAALKAHREYIDLPAQRNAARNAAADARATRATAIRVLAAIGDEGAYDVVAAAIGDTDPSMRIAAARAAADMSAAGADARGKKLIETARAKENEPRTQKQLELILKSVH
jgi:HEAT repeat protein